MPAAKAPRRGHRGRGLRRAAPVILAVGLLLAIILWRLASFAPWAPPEPFSLRVGTVQIHGSLYWPDRPHPPVAILVHGDGPADRSAGDGYTPLIRAFLRAGIAVASWDKPGVGDSTGHWLDQTMQDRAQTAAAVLRHIDQDPRSGPAGFVGFSQAGWVVPQAVQHAPAAFAVLIGAAVSWRDQGAYYTRTRLIREGIAPAEAAARAAAELAQNDIAFAPGSPPASRPDIPPRRFAFVQRAYRADSRADLARMNLPVLALWGAQDLNVDPQRNAALYATHLPGAEVAVLPGAGHGLLRAHLFDHQTSATWPWTLRAGFVLLGEHAFAPGALTRISDWVTAHAP